MVWLANSNGLALGRVGKITRGLLKIGRLRLKVIWQQMILKFYRSGG